MLLLFCMCLCAYVEVEVDVGIFPRYPPPIVKAASLTGHRAHWLSSSSLCLQHWGSSIQYWNKRCGHVLGVKDPNSCPNVGCKCFTCWAILPAPFPNLFKTTDSYSIKFVRNKKEYSLNSSPAPKTEKSILRMWSIPDLMSTSHQFKIQESYGFLFILLSLIND